MTDLKENFGSSSRFSLGIEEELQIIRPSDFDLVSRAESVIEDAPEPMRENIKHEIIQSVLEINTKICRDIDEAAEDLIAKRCLVYDLARKEGLLLASAGTHPFSSWKDQRITPDSRYSRITSELQWVARRELIFGLHVHVGVDDEEKAIAVVNGFPEYLPHLLALSANSPFWEGIPTKLQSTRIKMWEMFPRSGIPPFFSNWSEYSAMLERFRSVGCVEGPREFWWDVRPHPDFGTVEVRICDAQTEPEKSVAFAALIQAIVAWLCDRFEAGERPVKRKKIEVNENKWRASRYGLEANLIDFEESKEIPIRVAIELLLRDLSPYFSSLGSSGQAEMLNSILIGGSGSQRQLEVFEETGDISSVLADIVWRTYNIERHGICSRLQG